MTNCLFCSEIIINRNKSARYCSEYCSRKQAGLLKRGKTYTYDKECHFCKTNFVTPTRYTTYCPECVKNGVYHDHPKARAYAKALGIDHKAYIKEKYKWVE